MSNSKDHLDAAKFYMLENYMLIAMWLSIVSALCSMTLAVILLMEWKQPPAKQATPQAAEQREVR